MEESETVDIGLVLASWGKSRSLSDAGHIGYPTKSPYCADRRTSGQWAAKGVSLSEELHGFIDKQVSELKSKKDRRGRAVELFYTGVDIKGETVRFRDKVVARELRCSESTARTARIAGESWLESRVEINLDRW